MPQAPVSQGKEANARRPRVSDAGCGSQCSEETNQMSASARRVEVKDVIAEIDKLESARDGYKLVAARVRLLSESGEVVPEELLREQQRLLVECQAESQGR